MSVKQEIVLPDDLVALVEAYRRDQPEPSRLSSLAEAALRQYLADRGYSTEQAGASNPAWSSTTGSDDALVVSHAQEDRPIDRELQRSLAEHGYRVDDAHWPVQPLHIEPAPVDDGLGDVSINHDRYLADA